MSTKTQCLTRIPILDGKTIAIVFVAALSRVAYITWIAGDRISTDFNGWIAVLESLHQGGNPYHDTTFLNWPPGWLTVLIGLDWISTNFNLPFQKVLQSFLILIESFVLVGISYALRGIFSINKPYLFLLLTLALNPMAIVIIASSGNFDVLVMLSVLIGIIFLCEFDKSYSSKLWLFACASFGIGIFLKTFPVILSPLLFVGIRKVKFSLLLLGFFALLAPSVIGLGYIFLLVPDDVSQKVVGYTSVPGWFGITGLLKIYGYSWLATRVYPAFFFLVLLLSVMWCARICREVKLENSPLLYTQITAFLFLLLPTFGPGYGSHYLYWSLPFLVLLFPFSNEWWKRSFIYYVFTASLTLFYQYSTEPRLGAFGDQFIEYMPWIELHMKNQNKFTSTLVSLPQWCTMLVLLVLTGVQIRKVSKG